MKRCPECNGPYGAHTDTCMKGTTDALARPKPEMIARAVPKRDTQAMIKALRDAGLEVTKQGMKYECRSPDGQLLFAALNGRNNYLVRMRRDLFV